MGCMMEKLFTAPAFLFCFFEKFQQFIVNDFAFSDIENIKEICQRLWILCTWTSADHDRIVPGTVNCHHRDTGKIQNL